MKMSMPCLQEFCLNCFIWDPNARAQFELEDPICCRLVSMSCLQEMLKHGLALPTWLQPAAAV